MRLVMLSIVFLVTACGDGEEQPTPEPQRRQYSAEQRAAAETVMQNSRELATFEDHGNSLDVRFNDFIFNADEQTQYRLISSIADADAVLQGRPRTIRFYRTDRRQIGQADAARGIRLLD